MKRVMQTKFGTEGNCFSACIASLFEIPIEEAPEIPERVDIGWWYYVATWAKKRGLEVLLFEWRNTGLPDGYIIVGGMSAGGLRHAVIYHNGKFVHDPMPGGTGLVGEPEDYCYFIPSDYAEYERLYRCAQPESCVRCRIVVEGDEG